MVWNRGWTARAVILTVSGVAAAQGFGGPEFGRGIGGPGRVVTGEPFTDSSTSTSLETLANGATITHKSTTTEARDAEGRTFTATTTANGSGAPVTRTTVFDPVAHTMTSWSTASTVATQVELPERPAGERPGGAGPNGPGPGGAGPGGAGPSGARPGGPGPGGPGGAGRVRPTVTRTVLSPTTIAGVSATGIRTTMTVPEGAEGNDKPLVSTREVWTSSTLKIVLLETSDSPREGTHKMEVTSLTQGTPDSSLFRVPSNYTVKVETRHRGGR